MEIIHCGKIILSKNDDEPTNELKEAELSIQFLFFPHLSLSASCVCANFNKNSSEFAKYENLNKTHGKYHCNARITGILFTCWEAAGCHAVVAVALHAHCKQSFVVLGAR